MGALFAQFYAILNQKEHEKGFGFRTIGIPLSCMCHAFATMIAITGACRFFSQQSALARGKVYTGGWELNSVGVFTGLVSVLSFLISHASVSFYAGVDVNIEGRIHILHQCKTQFC
jgi:hypothetical protein